MKNRIPTWPLYILLFALVVAAGVSLKYNYQQPPVNAAVGLINAADTLTDSVLTMPANGSVWWGNNGSGAVTSVSGTTGALDTANDPMPQKERDALPKPLCIVRIIGGGTPMVGKDFIAVGCGGDFNRWEIWTKKDWDSLHKFWKAWEEAGKPMRSWIGNCEERK